MPEIGGYNLTGSTGDISTPSFVGGAVSATPDDSGSGDASGWLSGLGDLFTGVGSAVSATIRAANLPNVPNAGSGWVYNPTTGHYYNPLTGQALTATNTLPSAGLAGALTGSNTFLLLILAGLAFFFFAKRREA
jgi:hypothetical protein